MIIGMILIDATELDDTKWWYWWYLVILILFDAIRILMIAIEGVEWWNAMILVDSDWNSICLAVTFTVSLVINKLSGVGALGHVCGSTDVPLVAQIEIPPGTQSAAAFLTRRNQAGWVDGSPERQWQSSFWSCQPWILWQDKWKKCKGSIPFTSKQPNTDPFPSAVMSLGCNGRFKCTILPLRIDTRTGILHLSQVRSVLETSWKSACISSCYIMI